MPALSPIWGEIWDLAIWDQDIWDQTPPSIGVVSQNPAGGLLVIEAQDRVVVVTREGYASSSEAPRLRKDPASVLDFVWDWTRWLNGTEAITSITVTVPSGITLDSSAHLSGVVTAWISGGTNGQVYTLVCEITTDEGRTDIRRMIIAVSDWLANSNPFAKDPDAVLDYTWDWTRWLASGEEISTRSVPEPDGLTRDSVGSDESFVTAWMSGGTDGVHEFPCTITTDQGRTEARRIRISVYER